MRDVRLYFDFISPYSWLALMVAGDADALMRRPRGIDRARSPMRKPGGS